MGRRTGRKRKQGAREKNGRHQRKTKSELIDERVRIARTQPHRRSLKSNDRISELAESPLGRLALRGVITAGERAAGEAFAAIVNRYRGVINGPRPVRSLMPIVAPERVSSEDEDAGPRFDCQSEHGEPIEREFKVAGRILHTRTWPCQLPGEVCECAQRRARYMRTHEAIAGAGRGAIMAVTAAAVRGQDPAPSEIVNLKRGLRAAAEFLGLTDIDR